MVRYAEAKQIHDVNISATVQHDITLPTYCTWSTWSPLLQISIFRVSYCNCCPTLIRFTQKSDLFTGIQTHVSSVPRWDKCGKKVSESESSILNWPDVFCWALVHTDIKAWSEVFVLGRSFCVNKELLILCLFTWRTPILLPFYRCRVKKGIWLGPMVNGSLAPFLTWFLR